MNTKKMIDTIRFNLSDVAVVVESASSNVHSVLFSSWYCWQVATAMARAMSHLRKYRKSQRLCPHWLGVATSSYGLYLNSFSDQELVQCDDAHLSPLTLEVLIMSNSPVGAIELAKANPRFIWKALSFTVDLFMIVLAGLGGYFALQSGWKKSELDFHLNQLSDISGTGLRSTFVVEDPDRVYVKAIETNNLLEFAWRVYLPRGFKKKPVIQSINGKLGKNANNVLIDPTYCIARFKIKLMGDYIVCESHWLEDVSVLPLNVSKSRESLFFLDGSNFDDAISQAGKNEVQSFSKDDDLVLVRVVVPTSMQLSRPTNPKPGFGQISFSLRDNAR